MAVVPLRRVSAAAPDHAFRCHHPRAHLTQDLRPRLRDDVRRSGLLDRHAGPEHVHHHLPAGSLRPRCRDRHCAAADGRAPDRALPGLELARGDRAVSVLVSTPRPRTRLRPSTVVVYMLLVVLAVFYLMPMFAIVVTSLKSFVEVSRSTLWELPQAQ